MIFSFVWIKIDSLASSSLNCKKIKNKKNKKKLFTLNEASEANLKAEKKREY